MHGTKDLALALLAREVSIQAVKVRKDACNAGQVRSPTMKNRTSAKTAKLESIKTVQERVPVRAARKASMAKRITPERAAKNVSQVDFLRHMLQHNVILVNQESFSHTMPLQPVFIVQKVL